MKDESKTKEQFTTDGPDSAKKEIEKIVSELQNALHTIKVLHGILPICASCKKIRDDQGFWTQIELYIREHSEAEFTHGICPECATKLYPEYCGKIFWK